MKILEKIKERKKEVCITAGVVVTGVASIVIAKRIPVWKRCPYKSSIRFSNKLSKHAYEEYFSAGTGRSDGGYVGVYHNKDAVMKHISEVVDGESENRLYKIAIEKLKVDS